MFPNSLFFPKFCTNVVLPQLVLPTMSMKVIQIFHQTYIFFIHSPESTISLTFFLTFVLHKVSKSLLSFKLTIFGTSFNIWLKSSSLGVFCKASFSMDKSSSFFFPEIFFNLLTLFFFKIIYSC